MKQNGNEIGRQRFTEVKPVAPTGDGGPYTFSVDIIAELGIHSFEMILDINGNLTEAREDNNYQEVQLVVVEPYVAQVDTPNEVTRITPGGSDTVSISMLSTGSRTEPWTLTWDDSNLPDGWSVSEAPNQDTTATLVPGIAQNFDFYVSIPGTALGDDNSYIELFLTLDIDTNIVFSSILPIEVLRTRGLTIVGPSGLDNTDGFGRPGQVATGWMMVENLGNAYESTTSIDWTAPSWGGTPTLHDSTGNEVFSLNLAPNQQMELFVHLNTPPSTPLGSITTTTMTMCIGSGSETLCEDLYVNLTATAVTIEDTHHRTLPNQTLSWSVEGLIPDDGEISWNMASANMIHTGWIWTVDGDLVLNGSNIEASGTSDQFFSGNIYVDLPINAVPQRHYFNTESLNDPNHEMYFTMQVLQVYRSSATILQPIPSNPGEDISMFVEVTNQVLLRLENPGNGQDEFILETEVVEGVGMTSPPMVEFTTYNPQRTLGALATTIATVDVVVSEDTPAQESFILRFTWTSLGDSNVSTTVDLSVQAEPDHSWEVVFDSGLNHAITPKETVTLNYEVKNTGNAIDHVVLKPTFELAYFGQDSSSWSAEEMVYENITVNETVNMSLSFTAPSDSWSGTVANLVLDIYSEELLVSNVTLTFTVQQISGWRFNLSNTNLVIDPNGQNLTLNVEHLGNLEQQPWYSKAGDGWNISVPQNGELVQPYGDSTVTIFVSPPEDAIAGEVGVLRLRISDGDGSGQTIQEVPVRVGTSPDIDLYSKGNWAVNQNGGMPTAWVVNSGNDISILEITVSGLPGGWVAEYPESLIASPGQIIGIPVSLTPDSSWDGTTISVSLGINHPILGTQVLNLFVEQSNFTFLSTPVISGVSGDKSDIMTSFDPNSSTMEFPNDITSTGNTFSVTLGNVEQNLTLTDTDSGIEYFVHSAGYQLPLVSASCNLDSNSMEELGRVSLTGQIATCTLNSSPDERFTGSIILFTSMGEYVNLDENQFSILSGQTESFSINVTNWKPQAGEIKLTLMIVDSYGREIEVEQEDVISRSDGWNIGISEFSADGDIRIAITRTSYQRLVGVTCRINIDSPDSAWSETLIIDIGGIDYAPIIEIDNPGVLDDDDLVNVELRCDQPYDIDDNSEDDTAQAYYKSSKAETIEGSDVLIGILTSGLILVVAYFAGLLSNKPRVSRTRKDEVSIPVQENVEEQEIVVESDDEQDEFNLQIEEEEEEVPIDLDDEPVIEELRVDDSSASGRLASLRGEILIDEEPKDTRPISDRMDDFFKN